MAQRSKASSILVRTHHQGQETQVHRVLPSTPEASGNPVDLVARALYGRVKKDYKPVNDIRKGLPVSSVLNLAGSLQTTENYIINPRHEDFEKITLGPAEPYLFDTRLLKS
ncbi:MULTISPECIES: hypothetical protein [unclassified Ectothiorhodospira]|uniref:hypothetical protein n=1 Tax=unclassified Ectothiorhodospira TaxID=2684909 RepID=UPI001EE92156|nr:MULTISPECIES: hypothetical protein [unclassified Ectothiorhodospira]MCG5515451.1 hypothetical protein [Ectothiorhodospira sp. 9100]MCG5518196.1 hypothetical protein [Ectothiorhodospira sp. 9905]